MRNKSIFKFKQFNIGHSQATMKVGTDGVLLGAWTSLLNSKRILDVGTGSGVIALMLAQRTQPEVYIDAIDLSLEDCEVAKENVAQSPWPEKIKVHHSALQNFSAEPYDLIVSNPPYFINSYKPPTEKRTRARHTETLSQQDLLLHGKRLLHPNGRLSVILPETEAHHLISLSARQGWFCNRKCTFRSRANKPVERLLLELSFQPLPESIQELVLYQKDEVWSEAYQELTRDFYLKL
jgi:tRNA1Val (adenine37-N6)-methyltransferase